MRRQIEFFQLDLQRISGAEIAIRFNQLPNERDDTPGPILVRCREVDFIAKYY